MAYSQRTETLACFFTFAQSSVSKVVVRCRDRHKCVLVVPRSLLKASLTPSEDHTFLVVFFAAPHSSYSRSPGFGPISLRHFWTYSNPFKKISLECSLSLLHLRPWLNRVNRINMSFCAIWEVMSFRFAFNPILKFQQRTDTYFDPGLACEYFRFLFFGVSKVVVNELLQKTQFVVKMFFGLIQVSFWLLNFLFKLYFFFYVSINTCPLFFFLFLKYECLENIWMSKRNFLQFCIPCACPNT